LLHAGEVEMRDGVAGGPAIERAFDTLRQLPPNTLYISEEFVKEGRPPNARLCDAGARAGVKLYTIAPVETVAPAPTEVSVTTAELEAEAAAEAAALLEAQRVAKRKNAMVLAAVAAVLVLLIGGAAMVWKRRGAGEEVVATNTAPATPSKPDAAHPRTVYLAPFQVEGADATLPDRATAIRLGAMQILRTFPELRVVDTPAADAASFSALLRVGAGGPEILPTEGVKSAPPVALLDSASGIRAIVQWVVSEVSAQPRTYAVADALNSFADAVVARSLNDRTKADASLRDAMAKDPSFLPAQLLAMEYFASTGNEADALAAAKHVLELEPSNLDAARKVARSSLSSGDLQEAFVGFNAVLKREPKDAEALNVVARYSVAAGDTEKFNATLARMRGLPTMAIAAHEPDVLSAQGRIDSAIQRYYKVEETSPDSAALALKIGRLSVLRHSLEMAGYKLEQLQKSDPLYGYHMLSAYIAAEKGQRDVAARELNSALAVSVPGDDAWTSAAEVHTILNDTPAAMAALEKAAQRKEPTAAYVLAHPLFRYLENDPRFQKLKETLVAQQAEIRTALAQVQ
ncbi:MAG TPA: hypothetical protein VJZ00_23570, partial [Thermoanaerobaculia bacterium]|nr:hypothetical protein [Thermoanaerobaculia bacterium]